MKTGDTTMQTEHPERREKSAEEIADDIRTLDFEIYKDDCRKASIAYAAERRNVHSTIAGIASENDLTKDPADAGDDGWGYDYSSG